jgi:hypothetical protein
MADTSRATPADYNLRILAPLARYFEESVQGGRDVFAAVCERAGVERAAFDKRIHWVSWETAEAVLKEARPLFGSDEELGRACAYRMNESYGLMVLLGFGVSPRLVYAGAARAGKALTSVGKFTVVQTTARSARLRYESQKHESRLLCLSRQMQCAALPGLFGLPEAHVRELSCIARGDDCCEYEFTWINRRKWALPLLGVLLGAGLAYFLPSMGPMTYSVPLIAGLIGHIVERHRVATDNEQTMTEIVSALRQTMADEAEVRRELVALQERHEQWGRILERSRNDTQAAIDAAASKLSTFDPDQETALRGLVRLAESSFRISSAQAG